MVIADIFNGWANNLNWEGVEPELKAIFQERLSRCGGCEHAEEKKIFETVSKIADGKKQSEIQKKFAGYKCSKCGCKLTWKCSSIDAYCPLKEIDGLGKWREIIMDENEKILSTGL